MSKKKGWHKGRQPRPSRPSRPAPGRNFVVGHGELMNRIDQEMRRNAWKTESSLVELAETLSRALGYRVEEFHIIVRAKPDEQMHIRMSWKRDGSGDINRLGGEHVNQRVGPSPIVTDSVAVALHGSRPR